jgi:phage terminase large subunit GpA-like protein
MRHRDVFDDHDLDVLKDLTAPGIEALFDGMERASQALVPNEPAPIADWIEGNLVIPNGPRPGPVELDVVQRAVASAFQEDGARRINWLKPPRAGSSTLLALIHIYFGAHEGYDTIFYERSDGDAQKWHDDRLYPILTSSTALVGVLRPDSRSGVQDAWTDRYLRNGAVFQQRGVQTDGAFKAIRGFIVSIDEAGDPAFLGKGKDKEGNKVGLAGRRASEYVGSKLYVGGTPTTPDSIIAVEHAKTDKRVLKMPFPCCGHVQEFHRNVSEAGTKTETPGPGLKFRCVEVDAVDPETGEAIKVREISEIGYECGRPTCRRWLREDQRDETMEAGAFVPTRRPDEPGLIGFETWAIHSKDPETRWVHIVRKYLSTLRDPTQRQDFVNLWLSIPYLPEVEGKRDPEGLEARCEVYEAPCPQQALEGYWGIDKQTGSERFGTLPRHEAVLVGIGRNEEKWVLARRIIDRVTFEHVDDDGVVTEDWERIVPFGPDAARQLWDMVDEPWVRPDGSVLPIRRVGVDVSDEQERGMAMCAHPESRRRRFLPMKGRSETWGHVGKRAQAITGSTVTKGGIQLNLVGTQGTKDYIDLSLGMEPGQPFSFHFPKAVAGTDFFRQLTAETLVYDEKRPGLSKWVKERDHEPNEVLDCIVMAIAAMRYQWKKSATTRKAIDLDEGVARPRRTSASPIRDKAEPDPDPEAAAAPVTLNASRPAPDASQTGGRALAGSPAGHRA